MGLFVNIIIALCTNMHAVNYRTDLVRAGSSGLYDAIIFVCSC